MVNWPALFFEIGGIKLEKKEIREAIVLQLSVDASVIDGCIQRDDASPLDPC
jgi:hypothetical protein